MNRREFYVKFSTVHDWLCRSNPSLLDKYFPCTRIKWTDEMLVEEAKKYKTRGEFRIKSKKAYQVALKRKILNRVCKHMESLHFKPIESSYFSWTSEMLEKEAKKYKTRGEFKRKASSAYTLVRKRKIIDDVCKHMEPVYIRWTDEKCLEIVKKYKSYEEWRRTEKGAYNYVIRQDLEFLNKIKEYFANKNN